MKTSLRGRRFIQRFEQCRLKAYRCSAGVWTIGWGHTGPDVYEGKAITQGTADLLFEQDLAHFEAGVNALVKVKLTQGQFDALVSFAYNVGLDQDADTKAEGLGDSTLLRLVNAGQFIAASNEFVKWNKSKGVVLNGLTLRRNDERLMFLGLGEVL